MWTKVRQFRESGVFVFAPISQFRLEMRVFFIAWCPRFLVFGVKAFLLDSDHAESMHVWVGELFGHVWACCCGLKAFWAMPRHDLVFSTVRAKPLAECPCFCTFLELWAHTGQTGTLQSVHVCLYNTCNLGMCFEFKKCYPFPVEYNKLNSCMVAS